MQTTVVAFEGMLDVEQALLQLRHRPQVPSDGNDVPVVIAEQGLVDDRQIGFAGNRMIDLPPLGFAFVLRGLKQQLDFSMTFLGNCVVPGLVDPIQGDLQAGFVAAYRHITYDALGIEDQA